MTDFHEAQETVISKARSFGSETIDLEDADGRVLAEDIFADRNYPPFNRAAMDGFAIKYSDWTAGKRTYGIQELIFAGEQAKTALSSGNAYKIMTGASVPDSAHLVIRREDALENDPEEVSFNLAQVVPFQNMARQGEDLTAGALAITAGTICNPAVISTLATLGKSTIRVAKLPRVALFTTGNEIKPIDTKLSPVEIRNSNQWLIKSLLKTWLIKPEKIEHIADEMNALKQTIATAINFDIIIMCGGVSAGDADFVPDALTAQGVQKLFHKVAIKPGKPVWCGLLPHGGIVFALPGNPFSCLVNFKLLIEPYLRSSFGLEPLNTRILPFEGQRKRKSNLDEFFPAKIKGFPSGLTPAEINGSGDIRLGINADALACHSKKHPDLEPGMLVEYYPLTN